MKQLQLGEDLVDDAVHQDAGAGDDVLTLRDVPGLDVLQFPWATAVRNAENLVTRTIVRRDGSLEEESYALRGLVLWRGRA